MYKWMTRLGVFLRPICFQVSPPFFFSFCLGPGYANVLIQAFKSLQNLGHSGDSFPPFSLPSHLRICPVILPLNSVSFFFFIMASPGVTVDFSPGRGIHPPSTFVTLFSTTPVHPRDRISFFLYFDHPLLFHSPSPQKPCPRVQAF